VVFLDVCRRLGFMKLGTSVPNFTFNFSEVKVKVKVFFIKFIAVLVPHHTYQLHLEPA